MTILHSPWLRAAVFLVSALILPAAGCGDDSDDESVSDAGAGTGGTSGSGGKGGAGGKGGKGGTGGSSGKGGAGGKGGSGATTLTCGGATCTPNSTLAMIAAGTKACCTSTDKCGQTNSDGECKEQNAPGELDEACPTVDVDFMGMNYPQEGCCTPSGKCGGLFVQIGFGCLPREELLADQGGPLEAISCGSGSNDLDAGADDAGN